jgi:hypothetical protein
MTRTCCFALVVWSTGLLPAQDHVFPAGVVYGPKAAFEVTAPEGWVLDNTAGLSNGLQCVLYLSRSSWQGSPVIMYAKIASPRFERLDDFLEFTRKEYAKDDPLPTLERMAPITINDSLSAVVMSCTGGVHDNHEQTAYVQVPGAVCYVVFSARDEAGFKMYAHALAETVRTFHYRPEYIGLGDR